MRSEGPPDCCTVLFAVGDLTPIFPAGLASLGKELSEMRHEEEAVHG
jgi:hypothetical protein